MVIPTAQEDARFAIGILDFEIPAKIMPYLESVQTSSGTRYMNREIAVLVWNIGLVRTSLRQHPLPVRRVGTRGCPAESCH